MQLDPIFELPTPLVFAHRGGAKEVPESTEYAFRHAVNVGVDVLELDLQLTKDGQIVVWHGPELDNVYIDQRLLKGKSIDQVTWPELADARVVHPRHRRNRDTDETRRLLTLAQFIALAPELDKLRGSLPAIPWNIELKGTAERWQELGKLDVLFGLLGPELARRKIVLATVWQKDADRIRQAARHSPPPSGAYGFNRTLEEQLPYRDSMPLNVLQAAAADAFAGWLAWKSRKHGETLAGSPRGTYAIQTSHALVGRSLVERVHRDGGAVHAFLTAFPGLSCGVDHRCNRTLRRELARLVSAGVDGIMTDFPAKVVPIVRELRKLSDDGKLPPARDERGAPWFGAGIVIVCLVLLLLRSLLLVKCGCGIEDFLGQGVVDFPPFRSWHEPNDMFPWAYPLAWAYLLVDSVVLVPMYVGFGAAIIAALRRHSVAPRATSSWWLVLYIPLLALAGVDLLENVLGLVRIPFAGGSGVVASLGHGAHAAKIVLAWVAFAALGLAGVAWLFSVDRLGVRAGHKYAEVEASFDERTRLRAAIGDILRRSRYVLLALLLVGGLTVVMDQGRDVLYAMAAWPFRTDQWWLAMVPGMVAALALLAVATGALEYTCWLWTRSVCQIIPARAVTNGDRLRVKGRDAPLNEAPADPVANGFAKYWARALAFVPIIFLVSLHARVIEDGAPLLHASASGPISSAPGRQSGPIYAVFLAGLALIAFGTWLLRRHAATPGGDPLGYYSRLCWQRWCADIGFWPELPAEATKYRLLLGTQPVYRLPLLLGAGILFCRSCDALPPSWPLAGDFVPSLALAVMLFSIAFWLCLFGWLSMLEVRQSIPWVGVLVILVGVLGAIGWTDNHVVWSAIEGATHPAPWAGLRMLGFTLLILGVVLGLYWVAIEIARVRSRDSGTSKSVWRWVGAGTALILALIPILWIADANATSRPLATRRPEDVAPERQNLGKGLATWLEGLCKPTSDGSCAATDQSIPVYFVSTEGGGIRAAAWTAFVLERFASADADFLARTFSISGVSGGAVGAAVFRACDLQARDEPGKESVRKACLDQFAATDLLAPLLSAWLFEDVVSRVVPTVSCKTPGCGILSRGAWFEQALERGVPYLRKGLAQRPSSGAEAHTPYLLLNATWVESGERAIASDLRIDSRSFPGARDQLDIAGGDLPLGTAAHNAARFPYINPIGTLRWHGEPCRKIEAESPCDAAIRRGSGAADASKQCPAIAAGECGHLADGGYFDNSGGHTTIDVLHAFEACLEEPSSLPECQGKLTLGQRQWLEAHLVPQVLMIRNDIEPEGECDASALVPEPNCEHAHGASYEPWRPRSSAASNLFVGLIGPAQTLLNVSGIRAAERLAEARQETTVQDLRRRMGGEAAAFQGPPVRAVDLVPDGTLYPLGWHLSQLAIAGLWRNAEKCEPR